MHSAKENELQAIWKIIEDFASALNPMQYVQFMSELQKWQMVFLLLLVVLPSQVGASSAVAYNLVQKINETLQYLRFSCDFPDSKTSTKMIPCPDESQMNAIASSLGAQITSSDVPTNQLFSNCYYFSGGGVGLSANNTHGAGFIGYENYVTLEGSADSQTFANQLLNSPTVSALFNQCQDVLTSSDEFKTYLLYGVGALLALGCVCLVCAAFTISCLTGAGCIEAPKERNSSDSSGYASI